MTSSEKPHKDDKFWGAVAEALVAAYALISAAGKLSSYRPFTDVDGKDIVIDLAGGFKDIYLQVKYALEINRNRRIAGTVRLHRDQVQSSRIWVVPSAVFYKRAYRTLLPKGMIQFNFDCRPSGDERWDEFEVTRNQLGPRLVTLIRAAARNRSRTTQQMPAGRWVELAA